MTAFNRRSVFSTVLILSVLICPILSAQQESSAPPVISIDSLVPGVESNLKVSGPSGEYRVDISGDLVNWTSLRAFGSSGNPRQVRDAGAPIGKRFYRVKCWSAADGFYVRGSLVDLLMSGIAGTEIGPKTALGLNFSPVGVLIPDVPQLAGAERNPRILAATVGSMVVLAQNLRDTLFPTIDLMDIVAALQNDLLSGRLDGLGADGQPVTIANSASTLPSLGSQDLIESLATLKSRMPGLENIFFTGAGNGSLVSSAPGSWAAFRWDGAEWQ